ncbi:MAG: J domain-containing protein [Nitrospirota bacterium]
MSLMDRLGRILRSNVSGLKDRITHADRSFESGPADFRDNGPAFSDKAGLGTNSIEDDYLANLELAKGTSMQEIRSAYKRLIRKYHPDLHAGDEEKREHALIITQKLNEAIDYFEQKYGKGG